MDDSQKILGEGETEWTHFAEHVVTVSQLNEQFVGSSGSIKLRLQLINENLGIGELTKS